MKILLSTFAIMVALLSPALAADAPVQAGGIINIGQAFSTAVAPYIDAIVQALIAALASWVLFKFKQKTGIDIDQGHRDAIVKALQNQAGALISAGAVKINGTTVRVDNLALAKAANDLLAAVPDAAKHFGLTPDFVAGKIIATIPQTAAGAQIVAQATAAPTAVGNVVIATEAPKAAE